MTVSKIVPLHLLPEKRDKEVPLHVRIARIEDNLAQKVLQAASKLFLENSLNLIALEKVARDVTGARYVLVIVIEHPHPNYGTCARVSFGISATDPQLDCVWVPVDTRFLRK